MRIACEPAMTLLSIHPCLARARGGKRRCAPAARARREHGAAMLEFTIISVALLFLALLGPEAARWHMTRQIAYMALTEAARAAATDHIRPSSLQHAFEQALLPLHASPGGPQHAMQAQQRAFTKVATLTRLPAWRIEVLQPDASAFIDFGTQRLDIPDNAQLTAIDNTYQAERHAAHLKTKPDGIGKASGLTIFQANTLRLRLTYLLEPLNPLVRRVLQILGNPQGGYGQQAMARAGVLPIVLELDMDMQSHPLNWSASVKPSGAHIVYADCRYHACPP